MRRQALLFCRVQDRSVGSSENWRMTNRTLEIAAALRDPSALTVDPFGFVRGSRLRVCCDNGHRLIRLFIGIIVLSGFIPSGAKAGSLFFPRVEPEWEAARSNALSPLRWHHTNNPASPPPLLPRGQFNGLNQRQHGTGKKTGSRLLDVPSPSQAL